MYASSSLAVILGVAVALAPSRAPGGDHFELRWESKTKNVIGQSSVSFSPNGRRVVVGETLYSAADGKRHATLWIEGEAFGLDHCCFVTDSVVAASRTRRGVELVYVFKVPNAPVDELTPTKSIRIPDAEDECSALAATGAANSVIGLWGEESLSRVDLLKGDVVETPYKPENGVFCVSQRGRVGIVGANAVSVWERGEKLPNVRGLDIREITIGYVALADDDKLSFVFFGVDGPSEKGAVYATTLKDGRIAWHRETPAIWELDVSPDGRWIATVGRDRTLRILRASDGMLVATHSFPEAVTSVSFSPDGSLLCAADLGGTIRCFGSAGERGGK